MPARLLPTALLFALALVVAGATGCSAKVAQRRVDPLPVTVFLTKDITAEQKKEVEFALREVPGVTELTFESQEDAYRRFKEQFKGSPELVNATKPESLQASFRFKLADPDDFGRLAERLRGMTGVDEVIPLRVSSTPVRPSTT